MNKILVLILISGVLLHVVEGQSKKSDRRLDIRLKKNEPTIYITFEHAGKREPLYTGESAQGIWLRLHNNTRWAIILPSFGVPEALGQVGLFYEIEAVRSEGSVWASDGDVTTSRTEVDNVPKGYSIGHTFSPRQLPPGDSIVFSIPREHLAKYLAIYVSFNYEWEDENGDGGGREPKHYIYFYSSRLPKQLQ